MEINLKYGGATITEAENTVWAEMFTLTECQIAAIMLYQLRQSLPAENNALLERVENMFCALANDSDACIVHVETKG